MIFLLYAMRNEDLSVCSTANLVFPSSPNSTVSGGMLEPSCTRLQEPIVLGILQANC